MSSQVFFASNEFVVESVVVEVSEEEDDPVEQETEASRSGVALAEKGTIAWFNEPINWLALDRYEEAFVIQELGVSLRSDELSEYMLLSIWLNRLELVLPLKMFGLETGSFRKPKLWSIGEKKRLLFCGFFVNGN